MENKFISLLYPNEESLSFHSDLSNLPKVSEDVCDELGLNEIFGLKSASITEFLPLISTLSNTDSQP